MRMFVHFSASEMLNGYLIGGDDGGEALLVDPNAMDVPLLRLIETNRYYIRSILLTQPRAAAVGSVKTILKIYDAGVYASLDRVGGHPCTRVRDGMSLSLHGMEIDVIDPSGVAGGSVCFRMGDALFPGELLGAGTIYHIARRGLRQRFATIIEDRLLSLPENVMVFPCAGPPSSIRAERRFNPLW
jgi:hydroxyacylglutathione hydrolase